MDTVWEVVGVILGSGVVVGLVALGLKKAREYVKTTETDLDDKALDVLDKAWEESKKPDAE